MSSHLNPASPTKFSILPNTSGLTNSPQDARATKRSRPGFPISTSFFGKTIHRVLYRVKVRMPCPRYMSKGAVERELKWLVLFLTHRVLTS